MTDCKNILTYENLVYEVKNKDKKIHTEYARIINGLSGEVKSGRITAVMGASGCGKTHFFELLIGSLSSNCKTSGIITYNGQERDWKKWIKMIAFLPQDDIYYPDYTLYESIMYNLSFDSSKTQKEKEALANQAMKNSSIFHKKDAPLKTLSGGERKRAMIAITLANKPEILILDEPTTGLDSNSALIIVENLKAYAEKNDKIVIMTVHQPGQGLYYLFGDLIFLTKGGLFYSGAADKIADFLINNGIEPLKHMSISEFLFVLHSKDENSQVAIKYDPIVKEIERKNALEQLFLPQSCNNNSVIINNLSIRHSFILFKHNAKLLLKGHMLIRTLFVFILFASFFILLTFYGNFTKIVKFFANSSRIDFKNLKLSEKFALAYLLYLNEFISSVIIYTMFFSINVQQHIIWSLEIFTGKYSVYSHLFYRFLEKFLVCMFFLSIDFINHLFLNKGFAIPLEIMLMLYGVIIISLSLLIFVNLLISSLPLRENFLLLLQALHNYLILSPHSIFHALLKEGLKEMLKKYIKTGYLIMNCYFLFPTFNFDAWANIVTRSKEIEHKNRDLDLFFKIIVKSDLKKDIFYILCHGTPEYLFPSYSTDANFILSIFDIKITPFILKLLIPITSIFCLTLVFLGVKWSKVPNIRTILAKK